MIIKDGFEGCIESSLTIKPKGGKMMKNAISLLIVFLIAFSYQEGYAQNQTNPNYSSQSKTAIYTKRLAKINKLKSDLKKKKAIYQNKVDQFKAQINEARTEIKQRIASNSIDSYAKAENDQIISGNLQVIQKADAYIILFTTAIKKITTSEIEMARLEKLTKVDLVAVRDLENNDEFAELLTQIDAIITEIQPYANEIVTPKNITPTNSLEKIWEKYIQDETNKLYQLKKSQGTTKTLKDIHDWHKKLPVREGE